MTELAWTATRTDTIDRFNGQTPRPEDETAIIDTFELHPQLVLRAIDETARALEEGKITWAWSVLAKRLERGTTAIREATADTGQSKLKAIERARTWINNAGIHYDLERHVQAELFGDDHGKGILAGHNLTDTQRDELIAYWETQRPRGEQAETDHEAWNTKCANDRQRITQLLANRKAQAETADTDIDF